MNKMTTNNYQLNVRRINILLSSYGMYTGMYAAPDYLMMDDDDGQNLSLMTYARPCMYFYYRQEDAEGDPDFFVDLETDMLQECVQHGTVRRIVTPDGAYYEGAVAVVFADFEGAQKCAQALHGRFFDGQQIEVCVYVCVSVDDLCACVPHTRVSQLCTRRSVVSYYVRICAGGNAREI